MYPVVPGSHSKMHPTKFIHIWSWYAVVSGKCTVVRKIDPPPHTHTHAHYYTQCHNIMHMYCSSHLSGNFRLVRKIETPPRAHMAHTQYTTHTHNTLHIHVRTMCAYSTYSHLSGKCFLVRKIETPPPHTHNTAYVHMCSLLRNVRVPLYACIYYAV